MSHDFSPTSRPSCAESEKFSATRDSLCRRLSVSAHDAVCEKSGDLGEFLFGCQWRLGFSASRQAPQGDLPVMYVRDLATVRRVGTGFNGTIGTGRQESLHECRTPKSEKCAATLRPDWRGIIAEKRLGLRNVMAGPRLSPEFRNSSWRTGAVDLAAMHESALVPRFSIRRDSLSTIRSARRLGRRAGFPRHRQCAPE